MFKSQMEEIMVKPLSGHISYQYPYCAVFQQHKHSK